MFIKPNRKSNHWDWGNRKIYPSKNKPDFNFKLGQFGLGILESVAELLRRWSGTLANLICICYLKCEKTAAWSWAALWPGSTLSCLCRLYLRGTVVAIVSERQNSLGCCGEPSPGGCVCQTGWRKSWVEGIIVCVASFESCCVQGVCVWLSGSLRWEPTVSLHALNLDIRVWSDRMLKDKQTWRPCNRTSAQHLLPLLYSQEGKPQTLGTPLSFTRSSLIFSHPRLLAYLTLSEAFLLLSLRTPRCSPGHCDV